MSRTVWVAWVIMIAPAWANRPRHTVDAASVAKSAERSGHRMSSRMAAVPGANAITLPQAPGVVQTNLLDASNIVWFVTTEKLPRGSKISPFIILPGPTEIALDALTMTEDVPAGSSFDLPNIRKFGPFWPQGLLTYGVVVTINGRDSQTATDFPVNAARNFDDVSQMVPRISSLSEGLSERDVLLSIKGAFTSDPAYVLLEDMVVPSDAIRVSPSEIVVNLSKVPGIDLGLLQELLLTVGQSGWCDTAVFRHTPARPGAYNPAPL